MARGVALLLGAAVDRSLPDPGAAHGIVAPVTTGLRERAVGALTGLALGDALGMPTQLLPYETIRARYGLLDDFHPGPADNEISRGVPAGRVTDDTDQAVILGELLVAGHGTVDPDQFARRLLDWEQRMRAAGPADPLGPPTPPAP